MTANVYNAQHKGGWEIKTEKNNNSHFIEWGVKYQSETITDQLKEWELLDSAGYSVPFDTNTVYLNELIKTDIFLQSNRISAFLQDTWNISDSNQKY